MLRSVTTTLIVLPFAVAALFTSIASAEEPSLYAKRCASCHGQDGTAGTPVGAALKIPSFKGSTFTPKQIETLLLESKSHAGFGLKLASQELSALVDFLNGLAAAP